MDGNNNNNWDLFAVVRGCLPSSVDDLPCFLSSPAVKDEALDGELFSFPDFAPISGYSYELEDLCHSLNVKVEEQKLQAQSQQLVNSGTGASTILPAVTAGAQQFGQELKKLQKSSQTPRPKRRKNQKKVVCQVPADGVSNDMWAWRKYGQKPIKGSPYPRGYYRCSSSKGCQARKQVERSRANPSMLIITYTSEHNHPVPTHRNSLAGSTRQKLPPSSSSCAHPTVDVPLTGTSKDHILSTSPLSSPKTPLTESLEDELFDWKNSAKDEEEDEVVSGDEMLFLGMEVLGVPAAERNECCDMKDEGMFEDDFLHSSWFVEENNNAAAVTDGG